MSWPHQAFTRLSCGSSFTPLLKPTANQLHSISSTHSQTSSLPQFPQLSKIIPPPRPARASLGCFTSWGYSNCDHPGVGSRTAASASQDRRVAGRKECPCLPPRLPFLPVWPQRSKLAQGQGPSLPGTQRCLKVSGFCKRSWTQCRGGHFVPCPQTVSTASIYLPACLPVVLAGRHCHLLPAAGQDTPARLCHPGLALLHPSLQGTIPAGTLQHQVPQVLGQNPRHHLHTEPPFADAPLAPDPVGSTAPAQQQGAQGSRASVPPSTSRSTPLKGCVRGWYACLLLMNMQLPGSTGTV